MPERKFSEALKIKAFTTARDFKTPELWLMPGPLLNSNDAETEALREELEVRSAFAISPDLDNFDLLM